MTFTPWTKEENKLLRSCLQEGLSTTRISLEINERADAGLSGYPIRRSERAVSRRAARMGILPDPQIRGSYEERSSRRVPATMVDPDYSQVDSRWDSIQRIQQRYTERSKFVDIGLTGGEKLYKILSLSDIHFPFARTDMLKQALHDHADAHTVVLNGDIIDGYIYSTFEKDSSVAAIDEYNCAFDFVLDISRRFPRVALVSGNHDSRIRKTLSRLGLSREAWAVLRTDLIAAIANGERLNRDGSLAEKVPMPNVYYPAEETWWLQIGKTLFIHPHSRGSSKPAFTVSGWDRKFSDRLGVDAFDSVVCGHTHHLSKHIEGRHLLIEQGCLCNAMSYSWRPNNMFLSNAVNGYAVIYQDAQGNTDFNRSTYVYLGQLLPVDKPLLRGAP